MIDNVLNDDSSPLVGIIMESQLDLQIMKVAVHTLKRFKVPYEVKLISAHRTPKRMYAYADDAKKRGIEVIIAGASGGAHMPGMIASSTQLPVIGVPIKRKEHESNDSLLSMFQMPEGFPLATVGVNNARNAGLLALRILSIKYTDIAKELQKYAARKEEDVTYHLEKKIR